MLDRSLTFLVVVAGTTRGRRCSSPKLLTVPTTTICDVVGSRTDRQLLRDLEQTAEPSLRIESTVIGTPSIVSRTTGCPVIESYFAFGMNAICDSAHRSRLWDLAAACVSTSSGVFLEPASPRRASLRLTRTSRHVRCVGPTSAIITYFLRAPTPRWFPMESSGLRPVQHRGNSPVHVQCDSLRRADLHGRASDISVASLPVCRCARTQRPRGKLPRSSAVRPRERYRTAATIGDAFYRSGASAPQRPFERPARA